MPRDATSWAREFSDPAILGAEREIVGRRTWQLLGLAADIAEDGDWFTASLAGRSIFVQRFRDELVAFENVCAHRFFPLRTDAKGNGAIRCGFHGWMYNRRGEAVGVPLCDELYGRTRHEMDRRLRPIEIARCGGLIFGRLPDAEPHPDLADYLGPAEAPIRTLTQSYTRQIGSFQQRIAANWKASFHLTLDDYHIVATHPDSFGANGPVREGQYRYFDLGRHSALFVDHAGPDDQAYERFRAECAAGLAAPNGYRILQIFPNLTVFFFPMGETSLVGVADYVALDPAETLCRMWLFNRDDSTISAEAACGAVDFIRDIAEEDRIAAERLQRGASRMWRQPALSRQEQRIAWFDRAYAAIMEV